MDEEKVKRMREAPRMLRKAGKKTKCQSRCKGGKKGKKLILLSQFCKEPPGV